MTSFTLVHLFENEHLSSKHMFIYFKMRFQVPFMFFLMENSAWAMYCKPSLIPLKSTLSSHFYRISDEILSCSNRLYICKKKIQFLFFNSFFKITIFSNKYSCLHELKIDKENMDYIRNKVITLSNPNHLYIPGRNIFKYKRHQFYRVKL